MQILQVEKHLKDQQVVRGAAKKAVNLIHECVSELFLQFGCTVSPFVRSLMMISDDCITY
jgi:hypothetical protein